MLEALSRRNISRSQRALHMSRTSQRSMMYVWRPIWTSWATESWEVDLCRSLYPRGNLLVRFSLYNLFMTKLWSEDITVEHLLMQSNRGHLLSGETEIVSTLPDEVMDDVTVPQAAHITLQSSSQVMMWWHFGRLSEHFTVNVIFLDEWSMIGF